MKGRTYRYFEGDPLYPFGHGLVHTRFLYSDLRLDHAEVGSGDAFEASVAVRNVGRVAGAEVVQLYARHVAPRLPQARQQLRGFERVFLAPGEEKRIAFRLTPGTTSRTTMGTRAASRSSLASTRAQAGASSRDIRETARVRVR